MWFSYPNLDALIDLNNIKKTRWRGYSTNKAINRAHKAHDRHKRNKVARKTRKMQRRRCKH